MSAASETGRHLVVELQCPVEVYSNDSGGVVIRQDQTGYMGVEQLVILNDERAVRAVIAALLKEIGGEQ